MNKNYDLKIMSTKINLKGLRQVPTYKLEDYPDLKIIKKKYGEDFAKLCRELFPALIGREGVLSTIIQELFAPSRFLCEDIIKQGLVDAFCNLVLSGIKVENDQITLAGVESPEVLMDRAGYKLYKCETDEDVRSFRKYYAPYEELCTFRDPDRINKRIIFFAVKKNVDEIKREAFKYPSRQDKYGTSVISLQFTKDSPARLSIKNRYNHSVFCPDATFDNNLENIIPGLTESFKKHYGISLGVTKDKFKIKKYELANDGKYYRFNIKRPSVTYCPNNILIVDGTPKQLNKDRFEVFDNFILDKKSKELYTLGYDKNDAFLDAFRKNETSLIEKIDVQKSDFGGKKIIIFNKGEKEPAIIETDKYSQIIAYSNPNLKTIGDNFLLHNQTMKKLDLPNLVSVGNYFMWFNRSLIELSLPNLKTVRNEFLAFNHKLEKVNLPNLRYIKRGFLHCAEDLKEINLPSIPRLIHFIKIIGNPKIKDYLKNRSIFFWNTKSKSEIEK